jgi:hypothetical protein
MLRWVSHPIGVAEGGGPGVGEIATPLSETVASASWGLRKIPITTTSANNSEANR